MCIVPAHDSNHRYRWTPGLSRTRPPLVRRSCIAFASLGCALSRLHRAYDNPVLDNRHAIRSIRAGVSGRYPVIPPVEQSVL